MSLSPTAAAAAIARPRWSSSRDIPTTCAACKHQGEAQSESRHTTEDWRRAREGLRFDGTLPRTSRSLRWMESEVPTPLETDVEVKSDLVTAPRGCESCATLARYGILLWPAQTTASLVSATGMRSRLRKPRSWLRAATTA